MTPEILASVPRMPPEGENDSAVARPVKALDAQRNPGRSEIIASPLVVILRGLFLTLSHRYREPYDRNQKTGDDAPLQGKIFRARGNSSEKELEAGHVSYGQRCARRNLVDRHAGLPAYAAGRRVRVAGPHRSAEGSGRYAGARRAEGEDQAISLRARLRKINFPKLSREPAPVISHPTPARPR